MSKRPPKATSSGHHTFADVYTGLQASGLPRHERRRSECAVRRAGNEIGPDYLSHSADPRAVREKLNSLSSFQAKSAKTRANILSDFKRALSASGLYPDMATQRSIRPLLPDWVTFAGQLASDRERIGLSSLIRYCSSNGIAPGQVEDAVHRDFLAWTARTSLRSKLPNGRQIARTWNQVAARTPELQLSTLTLANLHWRQTRIPWSEFPLSLRSDFDAYREWASGGDITAERARHRPLTPATLMTVYDQVHGAADLLVRNGVEITELSKLSNLVCVASMRQIFRCRVEREGGSVKSAIVLTAHHLLQIARDWVQFDESTLAELERMVRRIRTHPTLPKDLMTDKNKGRLRQFDDALVLENLLRLPQILWGEIKQQPTNIRQNLAKAEAALAIAILTFMPIRLKNLTGLTIGKHLYLRADPRSPSTLEIPESENKNRMPLAYDIPIHLERMLLEYQNTLGPRILGHTPSAIFVNTDGRMKTRAAVRRLIVSYMKARVGIDFNPHAFRHLAGKLILDQDTGEYEQVRQLLGNKSLDMTIKYYVGVCTRRAGRHHQRLLETKLDSDPWQSR